MASDFNVVVISGRLARDVEVKNTPSGMVVANVSVAVGSQWFDKATQQKKEDVAFIDVTLFGKSAEFAGQYVSKGREVIVRGRLKQESWNDKTTGQKRSKLVVIADEFKPVGGKREAGTEPAAQSDSSGGDAGGGDDQDVPF